MTEKVFFQKNFEVGKFLFETYGVFETIEPNDMEWGAWERAKQKVMDAYYTEHPIEQRGTVVDGIKVMKAFNLQENLPIIQSKDL